MPRLDPEIEAKAFATFLASALVAVAKWMWEEGKKVGRRKAQTPDSVRLVQLEAKLADANAEVARLKTRCEQAEAASFDIRNRWQGFLDDRDAVHRSKQDRMYGRMKTAEAKARAIGEELHDLRVLMELRAHDPSQP